MELVYGLAAPGTLVIVPFDAGADDGIKPGQLRVSPFAYFDAEGGHGRTNSRLHGAVEDGAGQRLGFVIFVEVA